MAGGGDEQIVRLESDADLVQVVTVHKAKGLEYPLVFLPFACSFRAVDKRAHVLRRAGRRRRGGARCSCSRRDELIARPQTRSASARTCACSTWR